MRSLDLSQLATESYYLWMQLKGLEAQTIAHYNVARDLELKIIPVINKIDLPSANTELVSKDLSELLDVDQSEILHVSAKSELALINLYQE